MFVNKHVLGIKIIQGESKKRMNSEILLHIIKQFFLIISFLTNMYENSKKKNFDKQSDRPFKKIRENIIYSILDE